MLGSTHTAHQKPGAGPRFTSYQGSALVSAASPVPIAHDAMEEQHFLALLF